MRSIAATAIPPRKWAVTGLTMLAKKGNRIPPGVKKIMAYIKERNAELVTCAGCIRGVVIRIYSPYIDLAALRKLGTLGHPNLP